MASVVTRFHALVSFGCGRHASIATVSNSMPLKFAVVPVILLDSLILMPRVEQMVANRLS